MLAMLTPFLLSAPTGIAPAAGACSPTLTCAYIGASVAGGCGSNGCSGSTVAWGTVSSLTPVAGSLDVTVGMLEGHDVCADTGDGGDQLGYQCGLEAVVDAVSTRCAAVVIAHTATGSWPAEMVC